MIWDFPVFKINVHKPPSLWCFFFFYGSLDEMRITSIKIAIFQVKRYQQYQLVKFKRKNPIRKKIPRRTYFSYIHASFCTINISLIQRLIIGQLFFKKFECRIIKLVRNYYSVEKGKCHSVKNIQSSYLAVSCWKNSFQPLWVTQ